jgi:HAD superfamily hydrolase (TIGR01509 family)
MLRSLAQVLRGTSASFIKTARTQRHNTRSTIFNARLFSSTMSATSTTSSITSIAFDCGGVLAQDVPGIMYEKLSLKYPEDQRERIRNGHQRNYGCWNKFKIDPSYTEDQYWNDVIAHEKLNESVEELKALLRSTLHPYNVTIELVRKLKSGGKYQLGICSNHSIEWFASIAEQFKLYDYFEKDLVIVSQQVQLAKPSEQIFALVVQRFNQRQATVPNQVLFLDDKEANVLAANQSGLRALHFDADVHDHAYLEQQLRVHGIVL